MDHTVVWNSIKKSETASLKHSGKVHDNKRSHTHTHKQRLRLTCLRWISNPQPYTHIHIVIVALHIMKCCNPIPIYTEGERALPRCGTRARFNVSPSLADCRISVSLEHTDRKHVSVDWTCSVRRLWPLNISCKCFSTESKTCAILAYNIFDPINQGSYRFWETKSIDFYRT